MIRFTHKGDLSKTETFLKKVNMIDYVQLLEKYGREGVAALASATPVDSGETRYSWGYEIQRLKNGVKLSWTNSNIVDGVPVAILIQYGHGTQGGGYVQGRDFINPVIRPIFDKISNNIRREVMML